MRTAQGPFPMETTYVWEPDGTGNPMSMRNRGEPSGFAGVAAQGDPGTHTRLTTAPDRRCRS